MKNFILVAALLIVGAFSLPQNVDATGIAGPIELEGYAWSASVGWISMSCVNDGSCGVSNYGVQINPDGSLSGYAWASNGLDSNGNPTGAGWINFNPVGPYPSGSGTTNGPVEAAGTSPNLTLSGWARACSGAANPATCSGGMNSNSGGWDGWISMDGTGYGIDFVDAVADNSGSSFAWGGVNTMGWIDFSPEDSSGNPINPVRFIPQADIQVIGILPTAGTVSLDGIYDTVSFLINLTGMELGQTLDYTLGIGSNTQSGTVTETASGPDFTPALVLTNVPFTSTDDIVFEVDMPTPGVVFENDPSTGADEDVNRLEEVLSLPAPPPVITISGPDVIRTGDTALIEWTVSAPYDVTCTVRGPNIDTTITTTGGVPGAAVEAGSSYTTPALNNASRLEVSCTVGPDVYNEVFQIEVIPTFQEI